MCSVCKKPFDAVGKHTCSPPADLVRILQVFAQVPARSVILKGRIEFVQEGASGHDKMKRMAVRWRNAGIRLQPQVPAFVKWCNEVIVHIFYNIYDSLRVVY